MAPVSTKAVADLKDLLKAREGIAQEIGVVKDQLKTELEKLAKNEPSGQPDAATLSARLTQVLQAHKSVEEGILATIAAIGAAASSTA